MSSERKLSSIGTPIAEVELDVPLVYRLLNEQHPDLAHLPLQLVDAGWDNAMFRLGEHLVVRLPRRQVAATLVENEQTWLPQLPKLPIPIPVPYRVGNPSQSYPWRWSILPWLTGISADQQEPHDNQAQRLAAFLQSLHIAAPADAPFNPFRGIPLQQRADSVAERIQKLERETNLITSEIKHIWHQALNTPIDVEATWIHGDLHARNVLVENNVITGIIDWGDITVGDRATDLATIWMLFANHYARRQAIAEYANISEATLRRAKGWAVFFGVVLLDTGLVDNPQHALMGERTLQRVAADS